MMQAPEPLYSIEPKILRANEIHVWIISLQLGASELMGLGQMLSDDERDRATRYRFDRDRRRFIAARGRLRQVVGHYLGTPPR
ncbi:MAG: 4'-phosphopantetheinyl transferase, partial [Gammaproteobacteria bacterium]